MVKERNFGKILLLSFVTLGIYPIYFFTVAGNDINKICSGDGKKQMNYLLVYFVLGPITLGIFPLYWIYTGMNRLQDNACRYGENVRVPNKGSSYILWATLGCFVLIGPYIALYKFIENLNAYISVNENVNQFSFSSDMYSKQGDSHNKGNILNPSVTTGYSGNSVQQEPVFAGLNSKVRINNNTVGTVPQTVANYFPKTGIITGLSGPYAGYEFPIEVNTTLAFGKDPARCQVLFPIGGEKVSRYHCVISYNSTNGVYTVTDYSSNGTYLENGELLPKNTPIMLDSKTNIYLADRLNGFRLG